MFYAVEQIEMTRTYRDTTDADGFHVVCVVAGGGARVVREADGATLELSYAETGIIPGACGAYRLEPLGDDEVKVVKCFTQP
jgi:hypothetical protein